MGAWLEQRTWRKVGGISILGAAFMAWYGSVNVTGDAPRGCFLVYWLVFLLLFVIALYMALLDLRYIRMRYLMEERELYIKTMADEAIQAALRRPDDGQQLEDDGAP